MTTSPPTDDIDTWASRHRILTITRDLELATNHPSKDLFSHSFRFLIQPEAQEVLRAWEKENLQVSRLLKVAEVAEKAFPPLPSNPVAGLVSANFKEELNERSLATMLACPAPLGTSANELKSLAALKTLLLIRSLAQAERGFEVGPVIEFVSQQVRLATDRQSMHHDKLDLLFKLPGFNPDLHTYLETLAAEAITLNASLISESGQAETNERKFLRRIRELAENRLGKPTELKRPHPTFTNKQLSPLPCRLLATNAESEIDWRPDSLRDSIDSDAEQVEAVEITEYDNPVTAELQYRLGKGALLQTQSDRNFLPFAWNRLRPDEILSLRSLLAKLIEDDGDDLLPAFTHIALIARCSIETVCNVRLGRQPTGSNWTLDIAGGRLSRHIVYPGEYARELSTNNSGEPARDLSKRLARQERYAGWIRPRAEVQTLEISSSLIAALQLALAAKPDAQELGELWPRDRADTPWTAFNQLCARTAGLEHVTHGLLGNTAEQIVFDETQSAVMARMLLVPEHAVRPAAGWYASWTVGQANAALASIAPGVVLVQPTSSDDCNGLGSDLDPDDARLRVAFDAAHHQLTSAMSNSRAQSWIELHNQITTYSIAVLLACTAARPVSSVFERAADFDLDLARLFIDDKAVAYRTRGRWGRLVPLPSLAVEVLENLYFPYLRSLHERLQRVGHDHLDPLIEAIDGQLKSASRSPLPFFFHLHAKRDGTIVINEVHEEGLSDTHLFSWPLPWNLFRHRMATRLRTIGLDEELVAAQLGHAEAGAATFGDHSTRCWAHDEEQWRNALEKALEPLDIAVPRFASGHSHLEIKAPSHPIELPKFGFEQRQHARRETRLRAKRDARAHLQEQINDWERRKLAANVPAQEQPRHQQDRPASSKKNKVKVQLSHADVLMSIDPDRWTELGREMIFDSKGLPRANGAVWYEAYEEMTEAIFKLHGVRMRSRFAARRLLVERPAFHEDCIGISHRLDRLRRSLDQVFSNTPPVSKMPHELKEMLLAFDLCLNSRITDTRFLLRISAKNKERLTYHLRTNVAYVGFRPERTDVDGLPFAWFILPPRSFPILLAVKRSEGASRESALAASLFKPLLEHLGIKMDGGYRLESITELARLVDIENSVVLPGIAAASRSDRLPSWSVSAEELARIQFGRRISLPLELGGGATSNPQADKLPVDDDDTEEVVSAHADGHSDESTGSDENELYEFSYPFIHEGRGDEEGSRQLLREVRKAFEGFDDSIPRSENEGNPRRANVVGKINEALAHHSKTSSSAAQVLTAWILELLCNRRPNGKWLKARSILRYFSALSIGFNEYVNEIDLINADEVEIEDFYDRILRRPHLSRQTPVNGATPRRLQDERYILGRLMEFHRFAEQEYGIDSPDWSALGADLTGAMVSAHLISPSEYHFALESLCPKSDVLEREALLDAFLLLLAYRFGLRGAEAISLARSDWVASAGAYVVVISAKHRATKSFAGRRKIPLTGEFTEHERHVIDGWLQHWELASPGDSSAPLFFSKGDRHKPTKIQPHRSRIIDTLRTVCGNSDVTLHHARHSFANLLALRLIFPELLETYPGLASSSHWDSTASAKQLLGHDRPTRRAAWALAAALGHAHPQTTFHHYTHLVHDWANVHCKTHNPSAFEVPAALRAKEVAHDLERCPADAAYLETPPQRAVSQHARMTPASVLDALKFCGRGINLETIVWHIRLSPEDAMRLREAIGALQARRPTRKPRATDPHGTRSQYARLLLNRPQSSWNRVISAVGSRPSLAFTSVDAADRVADARQILVSCEAHLEQLKQFLASIDWQLHDIEAYEPDGYELTMASLAKAHGLTVYAGRQRPEEGAAKQPRGRGRKKRPADQDFNDRDGLPIEREVQVEMAKIRHPGAPRLLDQPDRLAIVPSPRRSTGFSRPEFVLVWLAMHLAT